MNQAALSRQLCGRLLAVSSFAGHGRGGVQCVSMRTAETPPKVCVQSISVRNYTRFAIPLWPSAVPSLTSRKLIIRAIRREPISQAQRNAELEEEAKKIDLAPHKLLQKGDPDSMQAIIKDVNPVGYFLTLPNGREGYLPALDLGFTGGIVILERLFKVGQELTVRIVRRGGGGREILSMKKPEFAPNTDPKFVFSERLKQMNQGRT